MKPSIIFFLLIIIAAYVYLSYRIWHILPFSNTLKTLFTVLFDSGILCLIVYFAMAFSGSVGGHYTLTKFVYEVGTSAIFVSLYALIVFLVVDLLRLVHVLPKDFVTDSIAGSVGIFALLFIIFVGGNTNYKHKRRVEQNYTTEKPLKRPLKLVCVSDIHLGYHNEKEEFAKWVDLINAENPDVVLMGGDLIDFSTVPLLEKNVAEEIRRIKAPVYACMGNHEYVSGDEEALNFYKLSGINLLRDQVADLPELGLCIVGRDDRTNRRRSKIPALTAGHATDSLYTIVLDHQPFYLNEAEEAKADFQFSGHTHYGQVWPITYIIDNMYECGYGPWQRGKTNYYVSSGIGIWGGKFRIGTQSEYVVVTVEKQ